MHNHLSDQVRWHQMLDLKKLLRSQLRDQLCQLQFQMLVLTTKDHQLISTTKVLHKLTDPNLVASTQHRFKTNNLCRINFQVQCQQGMSIVQLQIKEVATHPSDLHQWLTGNHRFKLLHKQLLQCNKLQCRDLHRDNLQACKLHQ